MQASKGARQRSTNRLGVQALAVSTLVAPLAQALVKLLRAWAELLSSSVFRPTNPGDPIPVLSSPQQQLLIPQSTFNVLKLPQRSTAHHIALLTVPSAMPAIGSSTEVIIPEQSLSLARSGVSDTVPAP